MGARSKLAYGRSALDVSRFQEASLPLCVLLVPPRLAVQGRSGVGAFSSDAQPAHVQPAQRHWDGSLQVRTTGALRLVPTGVQQCALRQPTTPDVDVQLEP